MRDTVSVGRVMGMAIALSILPIVVGCRPAPPPETSSPPPDVFSESKVTVQSSETTDPDISQDLPSQPPGPQSDTELPTLPTTPIESLPSPDFPKSVASNSNIPSTHGTDTGNVLTKGSFISGEQLTQGSLVIMDDEGIPVIELSHDFQTVSGPDLVLVLHQSKNPLIDPQSPSANLKAEGSVEISPLKSPQGQQYYSIPAAIILDHYNSIAIWCRESNAMFGFASFQWSK